MILFREEIERTLSFSLFNYYYSNYYYILTMADTGTGIQELMAAETRASQIVAEARIGKYLIDGERDHAAYCWHSSGSFGFFPFSVMTKQQGSF